MNTIGRLVFDMATPNAVYHAAFVSGQARPSTPMHTHDFYEVFYVLDGAATHILNDRRYRLRAGDLVFIYPEDRHAIIGKTFQLINVAFPAAAWECFCMLAGLEETGLFNASEQPPPILSVSSENRQKCAALFGRMLSANLTPRARNADQLEICKFWMELIEYLLPSAEAATDKIEQFPVWLSHACRAMQEEENLRAGLTRFVEVSGVSQAHLSRTLKAYCGQTPTEFLNEERIRRAAMLLASTPMEITDVALDCGFNNLSNFYHLFRSKFKNSPRAWRQKSQCIVMPLR